MCTRHRLTDRTGAAPWWRIVVWCLIGIVAQPSRADDPTPIGARFTDVVRHTPDGPAAVLQLTLTAAIAPDTRLAVRLGGAQTAAVPAPPPASLAGTTWTIDVPWQPGSGAPMTLDIERTAPDGTTTVERRELPAPDTDWVLHFIPGFHYDPVWWNTQAHYTETGYRMGATVGPGLTLVRAYLQQCFDDPDYTVALHQLPYLKPFVESFPEQWTTLRSHIESGRCAVVGGTYNELSTTLISAEATARNAIYGTLFQREVLGGAGTVWWQCDVFGHDPSFPSLMRRAGHTAGAFARGPFHQWGAPREHVNFPSEFLWMAPDGQSVLTHYMTGHYGVAYAELATGANRAPDDAQRSHALVAGLFADLRRPALTHHVLLPMHMDFIRPLENLGDVVRAWNRDHLAPRAVLSTPDRFFEAVQREVDERHLSLPVVTRDMNPIYTGCAVSYADLKTANRAAETTLRDAELLATVAALHGAPFPWRSLDRAWRQLLFNAHHDAVTGSMSDQVYVDVMYGYRDALDIATAVRDRATAFLNRRVVGRLQPEQQVVWNTLAYPRPLFDVGPAPTVLPACGYVRRTAPTAAAARPARRDGDLIVLENAAVRAVIDPERGGTLTAFDDLRSNRQLLRAPGNDLVMLPEYDGLPGHGEGPWHLAPNGEQHSGAGVRAAVLSATADRAVLEAVYPQFRRRLSYRLAPDGQLDMETTILDWRGSNTLLRVAFPLDLPGARPVFQTAAAVIGRPFARDVDTATDAWTLDQTCWQWAGLGATCAIEGRAALGVGEIILADDADAATQRAADDLAAALVSAGVTTTPTRSGARRYGDLTFDSNRPDFRVALGRSPFLSQCLESAGHSADGLTWVDWIERNDDFDLPVLIAPLDQVEHIVASLRDRHRIDVPTLRRHFQRGGMGPPSPEDPDPRGDLRNWEFALNPVPDYGVALVNRGSVSARVTADGTLALNLMRSCTGWPAGVWIDPPVRRLPDGASLQTLHGSHTFRYTLVAHAGDYRSAQLNRRAQQINHDPLITSAQDAPPGPRSASFLEVDDPGVIVMAFKPVGYPDARWQPEALPGPIDRVAVRLWNGSGRALRVGLRVHGFAGAAWRADLLEQPGAALDTAGDRVLIDMAAHAYETVICAVTAPPPDTTVSLEAIDPAAVPSAYWLENRGEGVSGNGIVGVTPAQRVAPLQSGTIDLRFTAVNNHRTAQVALDLTVSGPAALDMALDRTHVVLSARHHDAVTLRLDVPEGWMPASAQPITLTAAAAGTPPLRTTVWLEPPDATASLRITAPSELAAPDGSLRARLHNDSAAPLTGEAAWLSPQMLWPALPAWRQAVTVPAGETVEIAAELQGAPDSYALLRFAAGGRVFYGPAIGVTTDPQRCFLRFDVERLRLRSGVPTAVAVTAISRLGLTADADVRLDVPPDWRVVRGAGTFALSHAGAALTVPFELTPGTDRAPAVVRAVGPHGAVAEVPANAVPVQRARPQAAAVRIDGDLGEWADDEFTAAHDALGTVRGAVRYGGDQLVLAFAVDDAVFSQTYGGAAIWQGDAVQFGLSTAPSTRVGFQDSDYEYGIALTPDGPLAWCWLAGGNARTGALSDADLVVVHRDGTTFYELRLPATSLPPLRLEPGTTLGFTYIANDNDGSGFRGATQWTGGISGGKDPSLFGDLVLE